jgi:hypothetical protein
MNLEDEQGICTNLCCVVGCTKDQLGRPVITRANVRNVGLIFDQNLGRTEIAKLENTTVGVQKQVLGLNITMADTLGVNVCQRPEQLVDVQLHFQHGHGRLELVEVTGCAVDGLWDILEDEVEVDFIFLFGGGKSAGGTGGQHGVITGGPVVQHIPCRRWSSKRP